MPRKATVVEVKRNGSGGAFQPFHREKCGEKKDQQQRLGKVNTPVPTAAASSTTDTAVGKGEKNDKDKDKDKEGQPQRKQRRSWSPELHRRFLHALQQLGGSHGMCLLVFVCVCACFILMGLNWILNFGADRYEDLFGIECVCSCYA